MSLSRPQHARSLSLRNLDAAKPSLDSSGVTEVLRSMASRPGQLVDAAAQAEFMERKWMWARDLEHGYVACWVVKEDDEEVQVRLKDGDRVRLFTPLSYKIAMSSSYTRACRLALSPRAIWHR